MTRSGAPAPYSLAVPLDNEAVFHREPRAAGRSNYGWLRISRLAREGLIGFPDVPLRLASWIGGAVSVSAAIYGAYVVVLALRGGAALASGWASTIAIVTVLAGANLLATGIFRRYVGRIHAEVKRQRLDMVTRAVGFAREPRVIPSVSLDEDLFEPDRSLAG
jgi:polyisoprenyl-phosphate glycosyltransferase